MSATVSSSSDLLTAAQTAAKKAHATNAASSAATSSNASGTDALSSLTSNYNQFLTLLTAQLQHQDPTSPTQTDSFTSELAQFAGVEQQITTNTNLTQLLSLNQDGLVSNSASYVGKQAVVSSSQIALQNGKGTLQIGPTNAAETVAVAVTNSAGAVVKTQTLSVGPGTTSWSWDGKSDSGTSLPDGPYDVAVVAQGSAGSTQAVPFSVVGTITSVAKNGSSGVNVAMGSTTVDLSDVTSLVGSP